MTRMQRIVAQVQAVVLSWEYIACITPVFNRNNSTHDCNTAGILSKISLELCVRRLKASLLCISLSAQCAAHSAAPTHLLMLFLRCSRADP